MELALLNQDLHRSLHGSIVKEDTMATNIWETNWIEYSDTPRKLYDTLDRVQANTIHKQDDAELYKVLDEYSYGYSRLNSSANTLSIGTTNTTNPITLGNSTPGTYSGSFPFTITNTPINITSSTTNWATVNYDGRYATYAGTYTPLYTSKIIPPDYETMDTSSALKLKPGDKVKTSQGQGKVYAIDRDGTICVELESDTTILYEFDMEEIELIEAIKTDEAVEAEQTPHQGSNYYRGLKDGRSGSQPNSGELEYYKGYLAGSYELMNGICGICLGSGKVNTLTGTYVCECVIK
jgi:hypothetical protein